MKLKAFQYLSIFFILLFNVACSSLFYHPTKNYYYDPKTVKNPPEIIKFLADDGTKLEGWYFSSTLKIKTKALIVHFHGNAQNISTHANYFYSTADLGYDYFIFDYRGFGHSEGEPTPKKLLLDGAAALDWARARAKERNLPIVLIGQSLGGAVLMKTLAVYDKTFVPDVLVIDSSFCNYRSAARRVLAKSWVTWLLQPVGWLIVDNSQAPQEDLPSLKAKNIMVIHGTADFVVDYALGEQVFSLLPEPKEFMTIPDGYHTDFMFNDEGRYRFKFLAWLDKTVQKE
jgi:uncharacterized protein